MKEGPAYTAFDDICGVTIGFEGRTLDLSPADKGNWTSGRVGIGELKGSKFGISAAAYPTLDIGALTEADARAIYRRDYANPIRLDDLPPALGLLAFDAAVHSGVNAATVWLQRALGVGADGRIGPKTLDAVARAGASSVLLRAVCVEFQAIRFDVLAQNPSWPTFGFGWARRLTSTLWTACTWIVRA